MDELEEKDEDLDESGFGHDPVPKKGKGKSGAHIADDLLDDHDSLLDEEPALVEDEDPDEESLDALADEEDADDDEDENMFG